MKYPRIYNPRIVYSIRIDKGISTRTKYPRIYYPRIVYSIRADKIS